MPVRHGDARQPPCAQQGRAIRVHTRLPTRQCLQRLSLDPDIKLVAQGQPRFLPGDATARYDPEAVKVSCLAQQASDEDALAVPGVERPIRMAGAALPRGW